MKETKELTPFDIIKEKYSFDNYSNCGKHHNHNKGEKHPMFGKHHSEETRKKISLAGLGRIPPNKGKHHTEETKAKMSLTRKGKPSSNKGKLMSEKTRKNMSIAQTGKTLPKETKRKIREAMIGKEASEEAKNNMSIARKGEKHSAEANKKTSESMKKLWQNPKYKEKQIKAIVSGLNVRPTDPEEKMIALLKYCCPNQYQYAGNGSIAIGGMSPDFVSANGEKKVIEVFGEYWHSMKITGRSKEEEEHNRIDAFTKLEYDCLVIWENELSVIAWNKSTDITKLTPLINKILEFGTKEELK